MGFQQSLLMDQMKDLMARQSELHNEVQGVDALISEATKSRANASQRIHRFGENPRLAEEVQRATETLDAAEKRRVELELELTDVDEKISHNNEVLSAMLA